jgi:hypothetical protein
VVGKLVECEPMFPKITGWIKREYPFYSAHSEGLKHSFRDDCRSRKSTNTSIYRCFDYVKVDDWKAVILKRIILYR